MDTSEEGAKKLPTFMFDFLITNKITHTVIIVSVINTFFSSFYKHPIIHFINALVITYFLLEFVIKVFKFRFKYYFKSRSNKFDFAVLVLSLFFVITPNINVGNIIYLRFFRLLSLIKLLKLIPNSNHILQGVLRAIKASKAVLALLLVMLVFFSLLGFTLFSSYLPEFFGDPLKAMNSVFTIFTIENWGEIPEAAKSLGQPYVYYAVNSFVISVLILGGFIAVSLANAIFVDEMVSDNNNDLKNEILELKNEIQEIKELLTKE